jgi:hypothetical protein
MSAQSKIRRPDVLRAREKLSSMNLASLLERFFLLACLLFINIVYGAVRSVMLGHHGIVEWQIGFAQSLATGGVFSYPVHSGHWRSGLIQRFFMRRRR